MEWVWTPHARVVPSREPSVAEISGARAGMTSLAPMELRSKTSAEPEFRLVMPSRAEHVALVRQALSGALEVLELGESRLLDINAAVSEACNNVVVHAYEGEGPLEVYLCIQESELEVIVSDQGVGIRPKTPEPGLELQGLGLSLIQTLCDRVEFLGGIGEGTKVRMAFSLNGTAQDWARESPGTVDAYAPPGELVVAVSAGPLAAPVLGRVVGLLAARAGFSLEGISEAQLVTDSLASHVPRVIVGDKIQLGIDLSDNGLMVRVGPLEPGGAERVLGASAVGDLPPVLERLTKGYGVEGLADGELLNLALAGAD
jgi:serine/threonine-protein kinase RsbW